MIRKLLLQLHLWVGIIAGLVLLAIGVSGALLVFEDQIDHLLNPGLSHVQPGGKALSLSELKNEIEAGHSGGAVIGMGLPQSPDEPLIAVVESGGSITQLSVNQYTGETLGAWDAGRFTRQLHSFHTRLLVPNGGSDVVGWSSVLMLALAMSGVVLWWPRKVFRFDPSSSGTKFHFDLHNTVGISASLLLMLFSATGIVIHWGRPANQLAAKLSHVSPTRTVKPITHAPYAVPLDADRLVSIAQQTAPGAAVTNINFPPAPEQPVLVVMKYPEDRTPAGRTRVMMDAYSGEVLLATNSRTQPLAIQYVSRVNREIHTGDVYGWPTRVLAAIFSLALPLLALTGPMIWWNRRRSGTRAKLSATATAF